MFSCSLSQKRSTVKFKRNDSNSDGSFTVTDSNSFLSPDEILPMAQEKKYLGIFYGFFFFYFIRKMFVTCTH